MTNNGKSKVTRGAVATYVVYGDRREDAYVLRWDDVQRVEERVGATLEYTPQAELDAALAALEIDRRVPDQAEWLKLYPEVGSSVQVPSPATPVNAAARPAAPAAAVTPSPRPVASPVPPAVNEPVKSSRGPWGVIIPIIGGALALLLLLLLVRSCTSGGGSSAPGDLTVTPTATQLAETPQAGEPSVTATVDTPVRSGPGDVYPAVGSLLAGQTVEVVGKSADLQWWAIRFIAAPGPRGLGAR